MSTKPSLSPNSTKPSLTRLWSCFLLETIVGTGPALRHRIALESSFQGLLGVARFFVVGLSQALKQEIKCQRGRASNIFDLANVITCIGCES